MKLGTKYLIKNVAPDSVGWGVPNIRLHREMLRGRPLSSISLSIRLFGRVFAVTFGICGSKAP